MALPQIQIGENMIGDALLLSVEIVQELNQHWVCSVVCRNTEDQRIAVEQLLGQTVEVKTTDDEGAENVHFDGFVYDVQLEYEVSGSYTAHLRAVSDSYKLDVTSRKQYYLGKTLPAIASTVAGRDGVAVTVNAAASKALNYVQYGETDFSFLHRIVDDHGAWMRPKKGGLEVFDAFQTGTTLEWRAENGLTSFRLRGEMVPASFSGSHYDHHAMQSNTFEQVSKPASFYDGGQQMSSAVQSASQKLPAGFEPQRARAMTLDNYNDQLEAESERSVGGAVTGSGESRTQTLKAGNAVTVSGVLDAKGTYGLVRVVHHWTPQGYSNEFTCTPWKNYRNPKPPAARGWSGIVSARVVDHNDPKKMGRIKVQFFWQEDGSTHWARATAPHAGPGRGFMFLPEIGDEVAVAFEDGDPERPVILGSVWNGVQVAPREDLVGAVIANNDVKRLMTKSGNRVQMGDTQGEESITMATPHSTRLTMTEKSQSTDGRSLVMLESDGDIILSAPTGRVHIVSKFFSREIGDGPGKAEAVAVVAVTAKQVSIKTTAHSSPMHSGSVIGRDGKLRPSYKLPNGYPSKVITAAQASQKKYGIPASVTMAQWQLESGAGSRMPPESNNPFGMKAHGAQPYVLARTREESSNGSSYYVTAKFRKFDSIDQAFDEHGRLLANDSHYAAARSSLPDPDAFSNALTGVYATDHNYGSILRNVMDDNDSRILNK